MSIRPTRRRRPCAFSVATSSGSASSSPSSATGSPSSKLDHELGRRRARRPEPVSAERVLRRGRPGVLEHARLDRAAGEVLVDRVRRGRLRLDRDATLVRVGDLLVARPDAVAQRRDHLHAGVVRLEGELEADLVVALAGAAVHDRLGAELERELRDRLGDHRPRERGDQRVLALVEGVRLQGAFATWSSAKASCGRAARRSAPAASPRAIEAPEVGLLADVDEHGDDLVEAVVLLQPGDAQLVSSPPE